MSVSVSIGFSVSWPDKARITWQGAELGLINPPHHSGPKSVPGPGRGLSPMTALDGRPGTAVTEMFHTKPLQLGDHHDPVHQGTLICSMRGGYGETPPSPTDMEYRLLITLAERRNHVHLFWDRLRLPSYNPYQGGLVTIKVTSNQ